MFRSAVAVVALLAAAACGAAGPQPLVVPVAANEWGQFTMTVYDESGLVTGAHPKEQQPLPNDLVALPDRREIEVGWIGGACAHAAVLRVRGDPLDLGIELAVHDDPQLPFLPIACPAIGIPLRVTLSLSAPVELEAINFTETR